MFKLADEVKKLKKIKKKKKKITSPKWREGGKGSVSDRRSEGGRRREGGGEREEERGRRREAGRRVIPDHSHSIYFCLSHPIPRHPIPVWAKMLFKFCQHCPSDFLLKKYRVF